MLVFEEVLLDDSSCDEAEEDNGDGARRTRAKGLRVSSVHLIVSSRIFRAMFKTHPMREAESLRTRSSVEVPLPDDDYDAVRILMDIIHLRTKSVPQRVSLQTMIALATLVDKYEWHDAVRPYIEGWMVHLPFTLKIFSSKLKYWLWIAYVFQLPDLFRKCTAIATTDGSEPFAVRDEEGELPIPAAVTGWCY